MGRVRAGVLAVLCLLSPGKALAADQWIEVKSANFTVMSNAGDRATRRLVWQLEQMRSAMAALWTWAKPDLIKPLQIVAVKDESSMRALVPQYWEQRGGGRPASVWVTGPDQHYLVVRADLEVDSQGTNNPFITAYFSYVGLILDQSLDRDLPVPASTLQPEVGPKHAPVDDLERTIPLAFSPSEARRPSAMDQEEHGS